jgi:adenine-specific DNA-methyltransferase
VSPSWRALPPGDDGWYKTGLELLGRESLMPKSSSKRDKVAPSSGDVLETQVAGLHALFPECVVEGKIDFDRLKATLGGAVAAGPGRFSFTWAGRDDALALLQTPSRATLIPCPDESVAFDSSGHAYIEGDNLEVLKLLYKPYFGRIKLIYIDPPYNTGSDFVYPDNYADPLRNYLIQTGQIDDDGNLTTNKLDRSGRVHSGWLSMMYPRLFLARQLLREDGVICVSIDDNEVHHLRMIMNEIFGEENFLASVIWQKRYSRENREIIGDAHDYILVYAKTNEESRKAIAKLPLGDKQLSVYRNPNNDPNGPWRGVSFSAQGHRANQMYKIVSPISGKVHVPPAGSCWKVIESEYKRLLAENRMYFGKDGNAVPQRIQYLKDIEGIVPWTWWPHDEVGHTDEAKREIQRLLGKEDAFDTPKPVRLMKRILQLGTRADQHDLVLDFFSGSGTTAQAVLEQNHEDGGDRRFILVQFPETTKHKAFPTIAEMGKERIRRVIADLKERAPQESLSFTDVKGGEDLGFKVFKLSKPSVEPWTPDYNRDPETYADKLRLFNDPLVSGWRPVNVIWEIALRQGFGLNTYFVEKKVGDGITLYEVTDPDKEPAQTVVVCLDEQVRVDLSRHYPLTADTLFVCRDIALDDTAAANLALQCRLKTI